MSDQTIAAARARLSAAARALNEHVNKCGQCGAAMYQAAKLADAHTRPRLFGHGRGRCAHGARLAGNMTAAGMELEQERQLASYANTH